jgi:hypothetical protein
MNTFLRWLGLGLLIFLVASFLIGSGWCAGARRYADRTTFVQSGRSVADIHVDAAPGASVDATVHIGGNGLSAPAGRPAWMKNWQLCQDHFIYDVNQAPAGRCDHLPGAPAKATSASRPKPATSSRPAPCPPCDAK